MVLRVCFGAREGSGIPGRRCGGEPSLGAGVFLLLRQNQWALLILPNSDKLSSSRSVFKFLFYWFILTETKGVHLLKKKKKKKVYQRKNTGKKRQSVGQPGCRSLPMLVICCKIESENSSKRETCKFLSCVFKFASCVVSLL